MGCAASRTATAAQDPASAAPPDESLDEQQPQSLSQKLRRATTLATTTKKDARGRAPPPSDPILAARARELSERAALDGAVVLNAGSEAGWAGGAGGAAGGLSRAASAALSLPPLLQAGGGGGGGSSGRPSRDGGGPGGGGAATPASPGTPPPRRLRDTYVRATLVSYGASCKVFTAHDRHTGERVAVKTIPKTRPQRPPSAGGGQKGGGQKGGASACSAFAAESAAAAQRRRVEREIGALVALRGHPHVVRFVEAFEDARSYHIVMEHLSGGELFEHLAAAASSAKAKSGGNGGGGGVLTEATARRVGRALLRLLAHCHARGIAHMDVKAENIMFDADGPGGVLKVIDFGSAEWVLGAQEVRGAFGTVRYSSPEMANASAGQKTDVWSVGVVLYTLLSGRAPFLAASDAKTLQMIAKGPLVKFAGARWARVSAAARDAIRAMLAPDPADRPEAADALCLAWFAAPDEDDDEDDAGGEGSAAGGGGAAAGAAGAATGARAGAPSSSSGAAGARRAARHAQLDPTVVEALRGFACHSRARRLVMGVLAQGLRGGEAARLVATFLSLDADHDGTVSPEELRLAARRASPGVSDAELLRVFRALDVDNTGTVDAREFVAGVLHRGGGRLPPSARAAVAERTFRRLDAAAAGFFTREAFRSFLALSVPRGVYSPGADERLDRELDAEFDAMDENGDGRVTRAEFRAAVEDAVAGRGGGGGGGGGDASEGGSFSGDGGSEASWEQGGYASDGFGSGAGSEAGGGFGGGAGGGGGGGGGAHGAAAAAAAAGASAGAPPGGGAAVPAAPAAAADAPRGPLVPRRGASPLGRPFPGAGGAAATPPPPPPPDR